MHGRYMEKFNIIETYKSTDFQKIFIASRLDNKEPVLINILSDRRLIDRLTLDLLEKTFDNLIYLEKGHGNMVFIIKLNDNPQPLDTYLDDNPGLDAKDRINLIYNYLNKLVQYDELPNSFKESLVDASQISVRDNKVFLDEIIVLNENFLNNDNFTHIKEGIGQVIQTIIPEDRADIYKDPLILEILNFAKNLPSIRDKHSNFKGILNSYKNIFIYDFLNKKISDSLNTASVRRIDSLPSHKPDQKSSKVNYKVIISTLVIMALLITSYALINNRKDLRDKDDNNILEASNNIEKPTAYFEKSQENSSWKFTNKSFTTNTDLTIKENIWQVIKDDKILEEIKTEDLNLKFKEDGLYTISLKVRDSHNNWSDEYIKTFDIVMDLENIIDDKPDNKYVDSLGINILDDKFISQDRSIYRKGNFSYKFKPNNTKNPSIMEINDLKSESNLHLSMWLRSAGLNPFTIHLNGYNDLAQLVYRKNIKYQPNLVNSWDMLSVDLGNNKIHSIQVLVSDNKDQVWIADIEIDIYK